MIRAAEALADALHGALEPAAVGAQLGIEGAGDVARRGRTVRLSVGERRFSIVVRCHE